MLSVTMRRKRSPSHRWKRRSTLQFAGSSPTSVSYNSELRALSRSSSKSTSTAPRETKYPLAGTDSTTPRRFSSLKALKTVSRDTL